MAVDNFPTQFDKLTTTKDRLESRTHTTKTFLALAYIEQICTATYMLYFLWSIVKIVMALCCALFFGLSAILSRIRIAVLRRRIAKALLKQYNA